MSIAWPSPSVFVVEAYIVLRSAATPTDAVIRGADINHGSAWESASAVFK
jgi:hypothetical protein